MPHTAFVCSCVLAWAPPMAAPRPTTQLLPSNVIRCCDRRITKREIHFLAFMRCNAFKWKQRMSELGSRCLDANEFMMIFHFCNHINMGRRQQMWPFEFASPFFFLHPIYRLVTPNKIKLQNDATRSMQFIFQISSANKANNVIIRRFIFIFNCVGNASSGHFMCEPIRA